MNRRAFLASLGGAAALALDPERALWVPGAKLISIPAPRVLVPETWVIPPGGRVSYQEFSWEELRCGLLPVANSWLFRQ